MVENTYVALLEAPNSDQWRESTVTAPNEALARAILLRSERDLVEFSLIPPEPAEPVMPDESEDAEVQVAYLNAYEGYAARVASYPDKLERARLAYEELRKGHEVDKKGKARGVTRRGKAHLEAHLRSEPWEIVSIEKRELDVERVLFAVMAMQAHPERWERVLKELRAKGIPMAVVTGSLMGLQVQKQIDGSAPIVWSSATMKYMLTTSAWTPDPDAHDFANDVTNEVVGTGYTAGGATLGSKTSNYTSATDQAWLDAADTSWPSSTITARRAPLQSDTGGASSTDPLWGWLDFGADVVTSAGTLQITHDPTGIINFDAT
jgi:hypothetical protein